MKAGILTLQEADNYGAVLQAYALQKAIMRLEVESEFIIFERKTDEEQNKLADSTQSRFFAKRLRENSKMRSRLFCDFRREYLKCAVPIPKQRANELNDQYDFFLTGSDQVWNFTVPGVDGRYFLPFVEPGKRFSYAASFGGSRIPEQIKDWCTQQLKDFHTISVREEQGQEIVKELTGRDSVICIDPVFLLERAEWERLTFRVEDEPYLLLYLIQYNKDAIDYANRLAEEREVKVKTVTASFMYACGMEAWNSTGVKKWLSLIKNADSVITDSFHGCAFSMIFGRPLSVACLTDQLIGRNGRIIEILRRTGMERCMSGELLSVSEQDFAACMHSAIEDSYEYLKEIVEAANRQMDNIEGGTG